MFTVDYGMFIEPKTLDPSIEMPKNIALISSLTVYSRLNFTNTDGIPYATMRAERAFEECRV